MLLAAASGGLRALLLHRGDALPDAGLRAMVPVNVRGAAEQLALGNRITSLFVHLPVAEENPLVRYVKVLEDAERLKAGDQAMAGSTLVELAGMAPPVLHSFLAQSLFATRLFNVTVTNVPGPQVTLYALGSPLRQVLGLVPLAAEHAVGIAVLSYDGAVTFTINADRDAVPDVAVLERGIEETLRELLGLAEGPAPPPPAPARAALDPLGLHLDRAAGAFLRAEPAALAVVEVDLVGVGPGLVELDHGVVRADAVAVVAREAVAARQAAPGLEERVGLRRGRRPPRRRSRRAAPPRAAAGRVRGASA